MLDHKRLLRVLLKGRSYKRKNKLPCGNLLKVRKTGKEVGKIERGSKEGKEDFLKVLSELRESYVNRKGQSADDL